MLADSTAPRSTNSLVPRLHSAAFPPVLQATEAGVEAWERGYCIRHDRMACLVHATNLLVSV